MFQLPSPTATKKVPLPNFTEEPIPRFEVRACLDVETINEYQDLFSKDVETSQARWEQYHEFVKKGLIQIENVSSPAGLPLVVNGSGVSDDLLKSLSYARIEIANKGGLPIKVDLVTWLALEIWKANILSEEERGN